MIDQIPHTTKPTGETMVLYTVCDALVSR